MKLLDCTLRDGGYYTNWDFDRELVKKYLEYMEKLPIDYIEVGYRSNINDGYFGEYFYLPIDTLKFIKQNSSKKIAIMLNVKEFYNDLNLDLLDDLLEYVSLVRLATDPKKIDIAVKLAKEIKKRGFNVAINVMYISTIYENHIFFDYLKDIKGNVDILNLVDSYGSIYPFELKKLIKNIQSFLDIPLGFHGHNNLELAFINTLEAIQNGVEFVDSTVLGMGRGAGNLKTELLLTHLKSKYNYDVDLNTLGKLVELFNDLLLNYNWGTNIAYMISGSYSLPQKDVMDALEIDRYSLSGIISKLKGEKLSLTKYISKKTYNQALIIGGGSSVIKHIEAIKKFLKINKNLVVIHSTSKFLRNFKDVSNHQIFAIAGDELSKIDEIPDNIDEFVLLPDSINVNSLDYQKTYELNEVCFIDKYHDSPLVISLQISKLLKASQIFLVGYDGYNQLKSKKELYLMQENQEIIDAFTKEKKLISLTATKYKNLIQKSIYGVLCEFK